MKKLIIYATGGLSNRIFPIASGIILAEKHQRELFIFWPNDSICLGNFSDLYHKEIKRIDMEELKNLNDDNTKYHVKYDATTTNDNSIYGRTFLTNKRIEGKTLVNKPINFDGSHDILIADNFYLNGISEDENKQSLVSLKFKDKFINKANELSESLGLNKSVFGVHARGTDFNPNLSFYQNEIINIVTNNNKQKIFICSDDDTLENTLYEMYPNNIIRRLKDNYTLKNNPEVSEWSNNIKVTADMMEDSAIDLLLLSKTNLTVYNKLSTFGLYAHTLSEKLWKL